MAENPKTPITPRSNSITPGGTSAPGATTTPPQSSPISPQTQTPDLEAAPSSVPTAEKKQFSTPSVAQGAAPNQTSTPTTNPNEPFAWTQGDLTELKKTFLGINQAIATLSENDKRIANLISSGQVTPAQQTTVSSDLTAPPAQGRTVTINESQLEQARIPISADGSGNSNDISGKDLLNLIKPFITESKPANPIDQLTTRLTEEAITSMIETNRESSALMKAIVRRVTLKEASTATGLNLEDSGTRVKHTVTDRPPR